MLDQAINPLAGFPRKGLPQERRSVLEGRRRPPQLGRPAFGLAPTGFSTICIRSVIAPVEGTASQVTSARRWLMAAGAFFTGVYTAGQAVLFVVNCHNRNLDIWVGAGMNEGRLKSLCRTAWPGAILEDMAAPTLLERLDAYESATAVLGYPPNPAPSDTYTPTDRLLDPFIRANLYGSNSWAFAILAHPLDESAIDQTIQGTASEIEHVQVQYLHDATSTRYDQSAQDYLQALKAYHSRMIRGSAEGAWAVAAYLLGATTDMAALMGSFRATLSGPAMDPEPIHFRSCGVRQPNLKVDHHSLTFMPSADLGAMAHPPLTEMPGYSVQPYRRFSVEVPRVETGIEVGFIRDLGQPTGGYVEVDLTDLTSHTLIAGLTGMGKTNTAWHLLSQVWKNYQIPFLVLEPVKGEYREIDASDLHVYQIGKPELALPMNPFVFDGVPLHAHIDLLKALFAAAYVLYPPMPYILEQSLHEIYIDRGWSMHNGTSRRGPAGHERAWPTMTDLYHKVGQVTKQAGYDQRLRNDIQAALQVRIGNLRLGAKGAMLDTRQGLNIAEILARPTVIDLSNIGDDEQRAFFLGLFLLRLAEHVQSRGWSNELSNLVVIEEAHRLLRNVSRGSTADVANPRGQAVETFANLIAEIRAYGVGLLIAEQIPSLLAPEILKNSGTKIIHRLVDSEERDLIAGALNVSAEEAIQLTSLSRGEALVLTPQLQRPAHVRIRQVKKADAAEGTHSLKGSLAGTKRLAVSELTSNLSVQQAVSRLLLSGLEGGPAPWQKAWGQLLDVVREQTTVYAANETIVQQIAATTAQRLADEIVSMLGRRYDWSFDHESELLDLVNGAIETSLTDRGAVEPPTNLWHKTTTLQRPPLSLCVERCQAVCRYRPFVQSFLADQENLTDEWAVQNNPRELAEICQHEARQLIVGNRSTENGVVLCLLIHRISQLTSDPSTRSKQLVEALKSMASEST